MKPGDDPGFHDAAKEATMPMNWEVQTRDHSEDDERDDAFTPDEEDELDCHPGVSEACLGDWLRPSPR